MPRKERAANPTRGERFLKEFRYNRQEAIRKAANILDVDVPCAVDVPLREAIDRRLLVGDLDHLRTTLVIEVVIAAKAAAAAIYLSQAGAPAAIEKRRRAADLAAKLLTLVDEISGDAAAADEAEGAAGQPTSTVSDWILVKQGRALVTLLDAYAHEPISRGDATDHEAGQFFAALRSWWEKNAHDQSQHGAAAVRNRLAAALWVDAGGTISAAATPEAWAHSKFA